MLMSLYSVLGIIITKTEEATINEVLGQVSLCPST